MNYKYLSGFLGAALLVSVFLNSQIPGLGNRGGMNMHRMPDGTVMENVGVPRQEMGDSMKMPAHDMGSDMGSMMMDMTARLKGKSGPELEKIFLEDMIVHHQGAVDMAEVLLRGTDKPELIKFANDIISAQSKEIQMQKDWLTAWFPLE